MDRVTRAVGDRTGMWRFDRMAAIRDPGSDQVPTSFAGVANHNWDRGGPAPAGDGLGMVRDSGHVTALDTAARDLAELKLAAAPGT